MEFFCGFKASGGMGCVWRRQCHTRRQVDSNMYVMDPKKTLLIERDDRSDNNFHTYARICTTQ